ncbi:MAG: hypothetical protein GX649_10020 [Chloroflexi bacterium]|nr:hypothetical protein [Chloroflexota bacterium]
MADLVGILAGLAIGLGGALLVVAHRGGDGARRGLHLSVALAVASLFLLGGGEAVSSLAIVWPPGSAPTSLTVSRTSAYLVVASFWALVLSHPPASDRSPPSRLDRYWPGLALITCGLVVVALSLDQFMLRYVVLELVALGVVAALALGILDAPAHVALGQMPSHVWRRYLLLRCGDAALLCAILAMERLAGSFAIAPMIAAAAAAPVVPRSLVALSALAAVWVKLGLPPAGAWLETTARLGTRRFAWLGAVGLPVLGVYLLHRMAPVFAAAAHGPLLAALGGAGLLWSLLRASVGRTPWPVAAQQAHGALGLLLLSTAGWYSYLYSFIPVRIGLTWLAAFWVEQVSGALEQGPAAALAPDGSVAQHPPASWLAAFVAALAPRERAILGRDSLGSAAAEAQAGDDDGEPSGPLGMLARLASVAESRLYAALLGERARAVGAYLFGGLGRIEGTLNGLAGERTAAAVRTLAHMLHERVDVALEAVGGRLEDAARALSTALQRHHAGRLRRNLLWAVLPALLFIVLAVLGQISEGV